MKELSMMKKRISDVKLRAAKNQDDLMGVFQHQTQRIEQLTVCGGGGGGGFCLFHPFTRTDVIYVFTNFDNFIHGFINAFFFVWMLQNE
jgi:hypothetical protein